MSKKVRKKKTGIDRIWGIFKVQIGFLLIIVAAIAYYYVGGYATAVEEMKQEAQIFVNHSSKDTFRQIESSIVYDANSEVVSVLKGEKDVYYLPYDEIPPYVVQALVSIEDKKFFKHNGVDYKAIARAMYAMVKNGEVSQGASTITQQLARTMFLSTEKTWQRKVEEIYIAVALEEKYTKNEILEFYLNNVYFANGYYGIQAASKGYFCKDASNLSLSEACYLIAIPNSPTNMDPVMYPENTLKRRNDILDNLRKDNVISDKVYLQAKAEKIVLKRPEKIKNDYVETYSYYCATRALMELDGFEFQNSFLTKSEKKDYEKAYDVAYNKWNKALFTGGYRIYTSIDLQFQQKLQKAIDEGLKEFTDVSDEGIYQLQSAGVCIDNSNGMVKAIVGGRSQEVTGYTLNRGFQSFRQPGSSIKPLIVYTPSIERGYEPDSLVYDVEIEDGPKNSSGNYSGEITLKEAVYNSKNTVAWQLYDELTPRVGIQYLLDLGFSKIDENDYGMAACLGGLTNGVSPLEMAKGYYTIFNDGFTRDPSCIVKIEDAKGNIVYENGHEEVSVYKENAARTMTSMLESVIIEGTAKGISLGDMPCAGKTGTTNNNRDGWFVGYTNYYTTSIWVGYDMPKKVPGLTGSSYPAKIWESYMNEIHEGLEPVEFKLPVNFIGTEEQEETELVEDESLYDLEDIEDTDELPDEEPEEDVQTITQVFEGEEVPEGAIPEDAENVTITTVVEE